MLRPHGLTRCARIDVAAYHGSIAIEYETMPYSDNISDITSTTNDDALRAIESAFDTLSNEIIDDRTRDAVKAIARAIIQAIVYERTLNDAKISVAVANVAGLRSDIQRLIVASEEHKSAVSNRVHSLANFMMAFESKIDELSLLVTQRFESEMRTDIDSVRDSAHDMGNEDDRATSD